MYIFIRKMKIHQPLWSTLISNPHKTSLCNKKRIATHEHRIYLLSLYIVFIYLSSIHFLFHGFISKVDKISLYVNHKLLN